MKLGRIRSTPDKRTFQLINYVALEKLLVEDEKLPPIPDEEMMHPGDCSWPMLANDQYPCCTSTAAGHMVHHWTELNGHEILLTDDDIIQSYHALAGDSGKDGVSMLEALKYWRKKGIGDHRVHSFVQAEPMSRKALRSMVHLFGSAYLGLSLPNFAYPNPPIGLTEIPWEISTTASDQDSEPQESNGHCVAAIGYNQDVVYVVTWGTLKTMSWEFFEKYTFESYAVLSHDWVNCCGVSPSGFDIDALERDLGLVKAS
jgi:hypothetical protein